MLERRNVRGGRKNGLKIRIIDRFINSIKFPFEFQGGLGNIFQHFQRSNKMIDNEQRRETWQRYGNRPSSSLTSDIPSNESPTSPPKLFLRSVASYSASIIILFSRYRLCKNIFIFTRVCLYIYIYTEFFCNLLGTWRETFATRRVSVNRGQYASPRG